MKKNLFFTVIFACCQQSYSQELSANEFISLRKSDEKKIDSVNDQ